MKKNYLIVVVIVCLFGFNAKAQYVLTGTSYFQNFDSLTWDTSSNYAPYWLPLGWSVRDSAQDDGEADGTNYLGNDASIANPETQTVDLTHEQAFWLFTSGKFRNYASADGVPFFGHTDGDGIIAGEDSTGFQYVTPNRALGCRQVSPTSLYFPQSDPGAAFCFNIANTIGLQNFQLSFELQSLDSLQSTRITTWAVDYGFGNNPDTFYIENNTTNVTTGGSLVTGGNTFSNDSIFVDFGNALDNSSRPVWIRIGAFVGSTQTGDRATTAIDNYLLTWTTTTAVKTIDNTSLPLKVIGLSSNSITLDFSLAQSSPVAAAVYDITGREIYTGNYSCVNGENKITIQLAGELAAGIYFVKLWDNGNCGVAKAIIAN